MATDRSYDVMNIDIDTIASPVLRRLIEEVRNESHNEKQTHAYDRIHNRHNRSPTWPQP